jgi:hypothetical protein
MARTFLTAEWRKLVMANYAVDPALLRPYLPAHTELDAWNGTHYVSLVGFLFRNTKVLGIGFPGHGRFEEFNLRFYVRYRDGDAWKRGVVFVKEIVPKPLITLVANALYKEHYQTLPMRHRWETPGDGTLRVEYAWQVAGQWDHIRVTADATGHPLAAGSEEEYITEHFWGYTRLGDRVTSEYEVAHPRWDIHPVRAFDIRCSAATLYGPAFAEPLAADPVSVFLAEGSPVLVKTGKQIRAARVKTP